jgi:hypothetical protein
VAGSKKDPTKLADAAIVGKVISDIKRGAPMNRGTLGKLSGGEPVLTFSTMHFDSTHRRATASYFLWCGMDCGRGQTLLPEKRGQDWAVAKVCSEFVM